MKLFTSHRLDYHFTRMTAIRLHTRCRRAVWVFSTATLWCVCWTPILLEKPWQTQAKNSWCVRSKHVIFQIRENLPSKKLPSRKKKYSMLETRDNKLDRTDAAQLRDLSAIFSTNSSTGLPSVRDNCGSRTLSYKSRSKAEFRELAPSGCSRCKNRSHTPSTGQRNLVSSQCICEFSEFLFWRKSHVHSRIGANKWQSA